MQFRSGYERLVTLSRDRFYNAFNAFDWPARLPDDQFWISPELLGVAGTEFEAQLTREQLVALGRFESLNFYSLSVYGERDLCRVILDHIHTDTYAAESEYFHHFLEEENKHMWFFSQFCLRYGGKLYPNRAIAFSDEQPRDITQFLAFAKITIFEEIGDFYNVKLRDDDRLPDVVRNLNGLHHQDESRHLAMGRFVLSRLHGALRKCYGARELNAMEAYLKNYMRSSLESLYNPSAYRDAGIPKPYELRRALCGHPARREVHREIVQRISRFFVEESIFQTQDLYEVPAAIDGP
jgi:hypothetical protein